MTLPNRWAWTTLDEIARINYRDPAIRDLDDNLPVTFAPMAAVDAKSGTIAKPEERPLSKVRKGFTSFCEDDVIFAKITPCMENGKTAIARGLVNRLGFGSTEFHVLRPEQGVLPEWIFYFVRQSSFREDAKASFAGTAGQLRVRSSFLESYTVPLAPTPEQHRIVAEIEKQFTRLDAGVAALKRVQANLKRYKASVLKAACEGRLVPQDPNDEPASKLLERILEQRRKSTATKRKGAVTAPQHEPAPPDTDGLPELPKGWCCATWEEVSPRVTVGFVGPMKHEYVEDGVPFLRSQNVRENRFDPEGLCYISPTFHQRISKSVLHPGDLVVVRSGSVGITCVIPDTLPEANCADLVVIQKPACLEPAYGSYYMNSLAKRRVRAGQVGVALIHFNTKSVAALTIAVPPLSEQRRIVTEVERRLSVAQEVEGVIAANLARAERLRQSILKRAFEGKLLPQDPNDEPASMLLERIKACRAEAALVALDARAGARPRAGTRPAPTRGRA